MHDLELIRDFLVKQINEEKGSEYPRNVEHMGHLIDGLDRVTQLIEEVREHLKDILYKATEVP